MPKRTNSRPATYEDLDDVDRQIYETLPPQLQQLFLQRRPPIKMDLAARAKTEEYLGRHLDTVALIIDALSQHRKAVERAIKDLQSGGTIPRPSTVTALPEIPGISIRKTRGKRKPSAVSE
jgi:hypothetical protein